MRRSGLEEGAIINYGNEGVTRELAVEFRIRSEVLVSTSKEPHLNAGTEFRRRCPQFLHTRQAYPVQPQARRSDQSDVPRYQRMMNRATEYQIPVEYAATLWTSLSQLGVQTGRDSEWICLYRTWSVYRVGQPHAVRKIGCR